MFRVPSVTMNGGKRRRVISVPLSAPNAAHTKRPRAMVRIGLSPALTASDVITMVPSAMTVPLDRSMPAVRMTSV